MALGVCLDPGTLLEHGILLEPKAGKELRIGSMLPSIGSLGLGRAPESQAEAPGVLRLGPMP